MISYKALKIFQKATSDNRGIKKKKNEEGCPMEKWVYVQSREKAKLIFKQSYSRGKYSALPISSDLLSKPQLYS